MNSSTRTDGLPRTSNTPDGGERGGAGPPQPSPGTFDKLRTALGLDVGSALALLPVAAPAGAPERFLTTLPAGLVMGRRVKWADLAVVLQADVSAVRAGAAQLAGRLAAVGLVAVDDGAQVVIAVLGDAGDPVGQLAHLDAVRSLSPEAVMTLLVIGHLGEATRREVDERRRRQRRAAQAAGRAGAAGQAQRP